MFPPQGIGTPLCLVSLTAVGSLTRSRRLTQVSVFVVALFLAVSAHAAKPPITVDPLGRSLRVTFVAPIITSRETRYFVRFQTTPQEGCSWKSTSIGRHGSPGQSVTVSLSPNRRQGLEWCAGIGRVTVFLQRSSGGFVAKDATAASFKLVGTVRYQMPA